MFSFIKDCLLTFNYPLAQSMSEEELGDIFNTSNRCFLISWMLKLLDSAYEEALNNLENDKELLGDFVYELGFCTKKEKLPFMAGDLPVNQQVKIIFNMFSFITDIKKSDTEETKEVVNNDELIAFCNRNLNLFPMYGDIKLLKSSEKLLKAAEIKKEINDITEKVAEETKTEVVCLSDIKYSEDIEEFLKRIIEDLPNLRAAMESLGRNNDKKAADVIQLRPESSEIVRKCNENLKIISQFIDDIYTIEEFRKNNFNLIEQNRERNNEAYEMVKNLHQEVLSVIKYSRCI